MMRIGREKGFFVTYNHPTWSLESYPQYMSYNGMHAMEMYNGGANAAGFLDYNPRVYDEDRIICTYGIRRPHMVLDEDGYTVTSANFRMEKDFKYFRITVVAKDGKTACTNAYFADDLFEE